MNIKTILSISEARKKIFQIAEMAQKTSKHYILTSRGKPKIVLMSAEEFESWQETVEIMSDFPDLGQDIKKAEEEYTQSKSNL